MAQPAAIPDGDKVETEGPGASPAPFSLATPPRVQRGFAFLDLCGFTDFVDEHGDLAGLAELATLRRILREAAPLNSARIDKWLGDGALLVGLDLGAVVNTVLAVAREHGRRGRLPLRAGVAAGPAIMCDDDYVGRVVNLAARLCDAARPGNVLLQLEEGFQLPDSVWVRPASSLAIKGMSHPIPVVQLTPRPQAGDSPPR
jgi:class 3 adenylate cyclase